jgi:hypothetical protein
MTAPTTNLPHHLRGIAAVEKTDLSNLNGAPLVAISSVSFPKLTGYSGERFQACLAATDSYTEAGVPQLVMFGTDSHYTVPMELARRGAIVVPTPRPGLATPYLDAVHLVRQYAGEEACVLKAEGDKLINAHSLNAIRNGLRRYDVVVGDRTQDSMESMPPIQQRTEALLDATFTHVLEIPNGASSGVLALTPQGIQTFLGYEQLLDVLGNNWKYLLWVPAHARWSGLNIGSAQVDIAYDPGMVAAEDNSAQAFKRLEQLVLMLEGCYEVMELVEGDCREYSRPAHLRWDAAQQQLDMLRKLAQS